MFRQVFPWLAGMTVLSVMIVWAFLVLMPFLEGSAEAEQQRVGLSQQGEAAELERALEQQILRLAGVRGARVSLVLSGGAASALIAIQTEDNGVPTVAQSEATVQLAVQAVAGLRPQQVVVVDGGVRSPALEDRSLSAAGSHLAVQLHLEEALRRRVAHQLEPLTGAGRVRVAVFAKLRFPQRPAGDSMAEDTSKKPTPEASSAPLSLSKSNDVADLPQTQIERLSISLLLGARPVPAIEVQGLDAGYQDWTARELDHIERLVKAAVGFDANRGDTIELATLPLKSDTTVEQPSPNIMAPPASTLALDSRQHFSRDSSFVWGSLALILLLGSMLGTFLLLSGTPPASYPSYTEPPEVEPFPVSPLPPSRRYNRRRIVNTAKENPEATARILKEWLS